MSYVMLMMLGVFQRILKATRRVSFAAWTKSSTIWTIPPDRWRELR
jgi:hypothetical protein